MGLPLENFISVEDCLANDDFRTSIRGKRLEDPVLSQEWLLHNPDKIALYEEAVATFLGLQEKQLSGSDQQRNARTKKIPSQIIEFHTVTNTKPLLDWNHRQRAQTGANLASQPDSGYHRPVHCDRRLQFRYIFSGQLNKIPFWRKHDLSV